MKSDNDLISASLVCWWDSGIVRGLSASGSRLPADWYLLTIVSYASSAEILRFAQNDAPRRGGKAVTSAAERRLKLIAR